MKMCYLFIYVYFIYSLIYIHLDYYIACCTLTLSLRNLLFQLLAIPFQTPPFIMRGSCWRRDSRTRGSLESAAQNLTPVCKMWLDILTF